MTHGLRGRGLPTLTKLKEQHTGPAVLEFEADLRRRLEPGGPLRSTPGFAPAPSDVGPLPDGDGSPTFGGMRPVGPGIPR